MEEWKGSELRKRCLVVANYVHKELSKLLENWKQKPELITAEEFENIMQKVCQLDDGKRKGNVWEYCKNSKLSPEEVQSGLEEGKIKISLASPCHSGHINLFTLEIWRSKPKEEKDNAARKALEIIKDDENIPAEQRLKELKKILLSCGDSSFSNWLHNFFPDKYIHFDEYVNGGIRKLTGKEELIGTDKAGHREAFNDFALKLKVKHGLENLCDVYWFLRWIDEKPNEEIQKDSGGELWLKNYFRSKGFQFSDEQIFAFYNALKTKGFVILAGLSGTGKTKSPSFSLS